MKNPLLVPFFWNGLAFFFVHICSEKMIFCLLRKGTSYILESLWPWMGVTSRKENPTEAREGPWLSGTFSLSVWVAAVGRNAEREREWGEKKREGKRNWWGKSCEWKKEENKRADQLGVSKNKWNHVWKQVFVWLRWFPVRKISRKCMKNNKLCHILKRRLGLFGEDKEKKYELSQKDFVHNKENFIFFIVIVVALFFPCVYQEDFFTLILTIGYVTKLCCTMMKLFRWEDILFVAIINLSINHSSTYPYISKRPLEVVCYLCFTLNPNLFLSSL